MKKRNNCARCGKRESFGKSHESIEFNDGQFLLCIDCAQIMYKSKDAAADNDITTTEKLLNGFKDGIVESADKQTVLAWIEEYSHSLLDGK
jgi:hypothetical protein